MNKELSGKSKARLYGLTAISCLLWLIQTLHDTIVSHQVIFSISNIVFYLCLIIVIAYSAHSAYSFWKSNN